MTESEVPQTTPDNIEALAGAEATERMMMESSQEQPMSQPAPKEASRPGRPEYWPEDLWDEESGAPKYEAAYKRLSTAEKRAEDLRRALSNKNEAPDEYTFENLPEFLSDNVEALDSFKLAAKEAGLNNDAAERVLVKYHEEIQNRMVQAVEAEKQKLGADGQVLLDNIKGFVDTRKINGTLSEGEAEAVLALIGTADAARALGKIIDMTGEKSIPTSVRIANDAGSLRDIEAEYVEALKIPDRVAREKALNNARQKMANFEGRNR